MQYDGWLIRFACVFKLTEVDNELNEYLEAHGYEAVTPTAMEHGYMLLQNVVVSPAYLQVVKENAVAVNMYLKLGYERAYTYWYMKK